MSFVMRSYIACSLFKKVLMSAGTSGLTLLGPGRLRRTNEKFLKIEGASEVAFR